ncbi:hypothetical protein DdX_17566 [Ditylenchus destructor]|uniref:Uncharacterized protein n=1 Tax=Ditylenchus destructor TaxID=166010 RepID=A0AAD4MLX3_9BILA|nr:hypothetical protein DdX_17566 [Ditylenchus destructor]
MKIFAILLIVFMIIGLTMANGKQVKNSGRVKRQYIRTDLNSASAPVNPAQTNVYQQHGQGGVAGKAND